MRQIPNLLTLARLALTPFVISAILEQRFDAVLWLFTAAALTDALDGILARRFQWTSRVGTVLDPIADKALLVSAFAALFLVGLVPVWLVEIVFGRDLLLLAGAGLAMLFSRLRRFPPSMLGKLTTVFQIATVLSLVASRAYMASPLQHVVTPLMWLTAALTIASGFHYYWRAVARLAERDAP